MADKRWTGFPFGQGSVPRRAPALVGVPGALEAGLDTVLFWLTLALSLGVAFVVTVPVNRELCAAARGTRLSIGFTRLGGEASARLAG